MDTFSSSSHSLQAIVMLFGPVVTLLFVMVFVILLAQVLIVRYVVKLKQMAYYLDRIHERLLKLEEERNKQV